MTIGIGLTGRSVAMINYVRTGEQTWSKHGRETAIDQGKEIEKHQLSTGAPPGT
jgi:hypothetical protein